MARYLSRADLSRIAGKYIDQYYTRFRISKDALEPIDPERLASAVLGLNVKMLPLCSDGSILGLTVFQRCGFTVTLGDGTKLVEIFMPKDVVIDSALAAELLMPTFLVNAEIERAALCLPNGYQCSVLKQLAWLNEIFVQTDGRAMDKKLFAPRLVHTP